MLRSKIFFVAAVAMLNFFARAHCCAAEEIDLTAQPDSTQHELTLDLFFGISGPFSPSTSFFNNYGAALEYQWKSNWVIAASVQGNNNVTLGGNHNNQAFDGNATMIMLNGMYFPFEGYYYDGAIGVTRTNAYSITVPGTSGDSSIGGFQTWIPEIAVGAGYSGEWFFLDAMYHFGLIPIHANSENIFSYQLFAFRFGVHIPLAKQAGESDSWFVVRE